MYSCSHACKMLHLGVKGINAEKTVIVMVDPDALLQLMAINSHYVELATEEDVVDGQALQNVK